MDVRSEAAALVDCARRLFEGEQPVEVFKRALREIAARQACA